MKDIRVIEISTTSFEEENFILQTDLTKKQIKEVLKPLKEKETNDTTGETFYDNEAYFWILKEKYPNNIIEFYNNDIDTLTI